MATQGMLSIIEDGKVRLKVITGSDGYHIPKLKAWLIENPKASNDEIYLKSLELFSKYSLIVQTSSCDGLFDKDEIDGLPPLYVEKFDIPDFNPRWKSGLVEHYAVFTYNS